ncbi:MAG: type IIL restriction-modification enzyme MmeI [Myxococcota bacterium]|nr:type IIL restriction-modification enzyme MmeI [Myxococcota bacterium]
MLRDPSIILCKRAEASLHRLLRGVERSEDTGDSPSLQTISPDDLYRSLTALLLRILFLLYAEERALLPTDNPYYQNNHSLVGSVREEEPYAVYQRLRTLFHILYCGIEHPKLSIKPKGSPLFDPNAHPVLERNIDNDTIRDVLSILKNHDDVPIDFKTLPIECIGSVYEHLLSMKLIRDGATTFDVQSGMLRRHSGSHYTPPSLSEPLIRSTLEPLLGEKPTPDQILGLSICDPAMGAGVLLMKAVEFLGERLLQAWQDSSLSSTDRRQEAYRMIMQSCLYGVDKNPTAVQLTQILLWLMAGHPSLPFTFIEEQMREGDAILGRSPEIPRPISSYDRETLITDLVVAYRWSIHVERVPKKRERFIKRFDKEFEKWRKGDSKTLSKKLESILQRLPHTPLHWTYAFPGIFNVPKGGFDAIIGNPPFAGQNTIIAANGDAYLKLIKKQWPHTHGAGDICSYFLLRTQQILKPGGTFGLIVTNSISQGKTRHNGLQFLIQNKELDLYRAQLNVRWPNTTPSVIVTLLNGKKGRWTGKRFIDTQRVSYINSQLENQQEWEDPKPIADNQNKSFCGLKIYGEGFVLFPEQRARLIQADPKNSECIFPYMRGEELNNHPLQIPTRYVINFDSRSLPEAKKWPSLLQVVQERVKPERDLLKDTNATQRKRRKFWWQYGSRSTGLYQAIQPLSRCLACSAHSQHWLIAFLPTKLVFSQGLRILAFDRYSDFAILQSQVHEWWARRMGSTLCLGMRYTPSTCFETFPFPVLDPIQRDELEEKGKALYKKRANIMKKYHIGMTQCWNRLINPNNPHHEHPDIQALRRLRHQMDMAVLKAYGWEELKPSDRTEIVRRLRLRNRVCSP